MSLDELTVQGFRNLAPTRLQLDAGVNLVCGANGAGKSSLLEAIFFLGRVRSFRTRSLARIVQYGATECVVAGRVRTDAGRVHRLGVGRGPAGVRARVDGRDVALLSELAPLLPVEIINSQSQELLTGRPAERRRLLAWGVFHVERSYRATRRKFDRAVLQRNVALRAGDSRLARSWEPEIAERGELLDAAHRRYLDALWPQWQGQMAEWLPGLELSWRYRSGWPGGERLAATLQRMRSRDLQLGHTGAGPQRADLVVLAGESTAAEILSRGQQKLAVLALRLAQVRVAAAWGVTPVLLLDDLGAEMDRRRRGEVLEALGALGAQVVVTAVEPDEVPEGPVRRRFHVEQGHYNTVV